MNETVVEMFKYNGQGFMWIVANTNCNVTLLDEYSFYATGEPFFIRTLSFVHNDSWDILELGYNLDGTDHQHFFFFLNRYLSSVFAD